MARGERRTVVYIRLRCFRALVLILQLAQQCDIVNQLSERSGVRDEYRGHQLQQRFQRQLELLPNDLRKLLLLPLLQQRRVVQHIVLFVPPPLLVQCSCDNGHGSRYRRQSLRCVPRGEVQRTGRFSVRRLRCRTIQLHGCRSNRKQLPAVLARPLHCKSPW